MECIETADIPRSFTATLPLRKWRLSKALPVQLQPLMGIDSHGSKRIATNKD